MLTVWCVTVVLLAAACGTTPADPAAAPTAATDTDEERDAVAESESALETPESAESPAETNAGAFLIFGAAGEPDSINAMNTMSIASLIVTRQIEETLVDLQPGTLELMPGLAESWEPSADSTVWTFTLRQDVQFHDGSALDAAAVVFNFERMADPDFEYGFRDEGNTYPMFPNIFGGFVGDDNTIWESVTALDANTVQFTLTQPTPLFPNYMAAVSMGISSPDAIRQAGAAYGTPTVGSIGTGPFRFEQWRVGQGITLVRNEDYWGNLARMPGVEIRFIQDEAQRLAELQAGSVDFTINLPSDARETIQSDADLTLASPEAFNTAYLSININNPPFDNELVRQAVAYAIDRAAILESFYGGVGSVAIDVLPDGLAWARPADLNPYPYDPERARALLAEAGYPDGFDTMTLLDGSEGPIELWYMPVSRSYYPEPQAIAETFASYLADVGIDVELKTEDWTAYLSNSSEGKQNGLVMLGWLGDYSDPNNFLFSLFGPGVVDESGYTNEQVFDLLRQASRASSQAEATELFHEAGRIINQEVPRLPIVHAPPVYAQQARLEGWSPSPTGMESFAALFIEQE